MRFLKRLGPPLTIWLLTPLVAEFLLGDLTIAQAGAFPALAAMYGGGALLIREGVRRMGGGWPSFLCLALAYGLLEEGIVDQSLFNPDFMHAHLLAYGYWPAIGTAPPWTINVLTLHVVWSLAVPIGLAESLFPAQRTEPWLGMIGFTVTGLLFALGLAAVTAFSWRTATIHASPAQIAASAILIGALIAAAIVLRPRQRAAAPPPLYPPLRIGVTAFLLGSIFVIANTAGDHILHLPAIATVAAQAAIIAAALLMIRRGGPGGWRPTQIWAAAAGGLLVYAWEGWFVDRALHGESDLIGHGFIVLMLCLIGAWAGLRARRFERLQRSEIAGEAS